MSSNNAIRAFSDPDYDYYELTQAVGFLPRGTVFYHDTDDHIYGSIGNGCLKLCWTDDGNCVGNHNQQICGGTVIFHFEFAKTSLFRKIELKDKFKNLTIKEIEKQLGYRIKIVSED